MVKQTDYDWDKQQWFVVNLLEEIKKTMKNKKIQ